MHEVLMLDETMTSLALVEFINVERRREANEKCPAAMIYEPATPRHDNFMAKVQSHPGIDSPKFLGQYQDGTGRTLKCYFLPRRECELMVMGESLRVQTRVYDRLKLMESKVSAPPVLTLPSYADALRQLADKIEETELQKTQLAIAAPKAAFVDRYVVSTGLKGFREVCKLLGANESRFREFLTDNKIMYRLGGSMTAHAQHLDAGRFEVRAGSSEVSGHAFNACKFTSKGVEWVAGEWAKHQIRSEVAA